jgi:4'-phosphopantetheinyl transferase
MMRRDATPNEPAVARLPQPLPGVDLWWCDLDRRAVDAAALAALLSDAERERAARFGTDRLRHRWIAGRATLRELLAAALGTTAKDVPLRRGRRGRPEIAVDGAADFNVSHTRGVAAFAIGHGLAHEVRIGIDIERHDRNVGFDRLARKVLTAREQQSLASLDAEARRLRLLRAWTYKEAMSKATGDGLIAPFAKLELELDGDPHLLAGPPPYDPDRWQLVAPDVPTYFCAIALWSIRESRSP